MTSNRQNERPTFFRPLRTVRRHCCILCNLPGKVLYRNVKDRMHNTPGEWDIRECSSSSCGLLWLDPLPHPQDIHLAYATYYTHAPQAADRHWMRRFAASVQERYLHKRWGYTRNRSASWIDRLLLCAPRLHPGLQAYLDSSVMHLKALPDGRLLDVGSGSGEAIERMGALGWRAEGLEVDAQAVAYAQQRGLQVTHGDLERFSSDHLFDAITMTHVIEHLTNPLKAVQICFDLLKQGGQLVITTPNTKSTIHRRFKQCWLSLDPPRHLFAFNPSSLQDLARQAGFKDLRLKMEVREANTVHIASQMIKKNGHWRRGDLGSFRSRIQGQWVQYLQKLRTLQRKDVTEELVLIARK